MGANGAVEQISGEPPTHTADSVQLHDCNDCARPILVSLKSRPDWNMTKNEKWDHASVMTVWNRVSGVANRAFTTSLTLPSSPARIVGRTMPVNTLLVAWKAMSHRGGWPTGKTINSFDWKWEGVARFNRESTIISICVQPCVLVSFV